METFRDKALEHLTRYKLEKLKITEAGVWKDRSGNMVERSHILPKGHEDQNILPAVRELFQEYRRANAGLQLHPGFHNHLNSSQAVAFNLFLPLISQPIRLAQVLEIQGSEIIHSKLEHVFREDQTNADLYAVTDAADRVIVELKYSEPGFGTSKPDASHAQKLLETYAPRLSSQLPASFLEPEFFAKNYQLLRYVFHLRPGTNDRLVLIFPKANTLSGAEQFIMEHLPQKLQKERIRIMYLEECVSRIQSALSSDAEWLLHYQGFSERYLFTT